MLLPEIDHYEDYDLTNSNARRQKPTKFPESTDEDSYGRIEKRLKPRRRRLSPSLRLYGWKPGQSINPKLPLAGTHQEVSHSSFPRLRSFGQKLSDEERNIIDLFILKLGPEHVRRSTVNYDPPTSRILLEGRSDELLAKASGTAFENLVYLWLAEQKRKSGIMLLDTGSCHRVFRSITQFTPNPFLPDGADIKFNQRRVPIIDALYEYKLNPQLQFLETENRLRTMEYFLRTAAGTFLGFRKPLKFDLVQGVNSHTIGFSPRPQVFLVAPASRSYETQTPNIQVIKAPFTTAFVVEVARRSLQDLLLPD